MDNPVPDMQSIANQLMNDDLELLFESDKDKPPPDDLTLTNQNDQSYWNIELEALDTPQMLLLSHTNPTSEQPDQSHCTAITFKPELDSPPLERSASLDEESLGLAVLETEATGSKGPIIKETIRSKIQKKRREKGLEELVVEKKVQSEEKLSAADEERRRKRKESNRKAAKKCRIKKRKAEEQSLQEKIQLEVENIELRSTVEQLQMELEELKYKLAEHTKCCSQVPSGSFT